MLKWIIAGIVIAIICSFPIMFNLFGKEDQCGRTLWDKIKAKFTKNK